MSAQGVSFSLFTKMWKEMTIGELGEFVVALGFDGIELPLRDGYPVEPGNAATELSKAAKTLAGLGVQITSVAGATDESTIEACAAAGVPVIRTCPQITEEGYIASIERHWREFDELVPVLEKTRWPSAFRITVTSGSATLWA